MKKTKKTVLTAAMFSAAISMSTHAATSADYQKVYGQPSYLESETVTTTTASTYAPLYGPPVYYPTQKQDALTGDLNSDGEIDIFDTIIARKGIIDGFEYYETELLADVNEDGIFNVSDLILLNKYIIGDITDFDDPRYDIPQDVYGPPPYFDETTEVTTFPGEQNSTITSTTLQTLYGPPLTRN